MLIAEERVGRLLAELGLDAVEGEAHVRQPPRRGVAFLAEDRDVRALAAVGLDELFALHEHAARAAGGVVDAAGVGLKHLDQHEPHCGVGGRKGADQGGAIKRTKLDARIDSRPLKPIPSRPLKPIPLNPFPLKPISAALAAAPGLVTRSVAATLSKTCHARKAKTLAKRAIFLRMHEASVGLSLRSLSRPHSERMVAGQSSAFFSLGVRWNLLTESEVQRTFNKLFRDSDVSQEKLERGEQLLELLRPESPLRFRLEEQLEELRKLCAS